MAEKIKPYYTTKVIREYGSMRQRNTPSETYEDATVRGVDRSGLPNPAFMLRIPLDEDAETGEMLDVDGDRAMERILMYGAEIDVWGDGELRVSGFVPDDGLGSTSFHIEQWWMMVRDGAEE